MPQATPQTRDRRAQQKDSQPLTWELLLPPLPQPHRKTATLPLVAADLNAAAVQFHRILDDRQAQAGALNGASA